MSCKGTTLQLINLKRKLCCQLSPSAKGILPNIASVFKYYSDIFIARLGKGCGYMPKYANSNIGNFVWRSSFTTKDGKKIYARDYGLKAFKIPI